MGSRRKLSISILSHLRTETLLSPHLPLHPHDYHPNPSSLFTRSFIISRNPRVSVPLLRQSLPESRPPWRPSYSSESDAVAAAAAAASSRCWNCSAEPPASSPLPFLFCGSCRSVQPVDSSVDYFQIFGLEKGYETVGDNLEVKYKDWQKKLHPDLVHSKSEKEKEFAAEQSARVIDAYRTLSGPLSRAIYLLKLEGIHVDEEKTVADQDLLLEIMEVRESVEEANDSQALKQIRSQIQKKFETWSNSFGEAFRKCNFDDAMASIRRMRYYERAIEEIVKKL